MVQGIVMITRPYLSIRHVMITLIWTGMRRFLRLEASAFGNGWNLVERPPTGCGFDDQHGSQDSLVVSNGRHGIGESGETCAANNGEIVCSLNRLHYRNLLFGLNVEND